MLHDTTFRLVRPLRSGLLVALVILSATWFPAARAENPRITPVVRAFQAASPSVVNIHGQKTVRATTAGFPGTTPDSFRQVNGMGTGIVIDRRGYVVTNYHVVEDVADIRVTLHDQTKTSARLIAYSRPDDLAVIKVSAGESLPTIPRGSSQDLMVGEPVLAIGNAFGYENTLTQGIISALHRDVPVNETQQYRDLIQTSAGINPGNSGGPLLNINGEMIGINVAVRVGAQQIAFTIPVDQAMQTVTEMLHDYNRRTAPLGLVGLLGEGTSDLEIRRSIGTELLPGDRIVKLGGYEVDNRFELALAAIDIDPGDRVNLVIDRNGERKTFTLHAGEPADDTSRGPEELAWSWLGIRAEPLSPGEVQTMNRRTGQSFKGGLLVTSLRPDSPAERNGIQAGDVLVSIHAWRTASLGELGLIARHRELQNLKEAKFHIVRQNRAFVGQLPVAELRTTLR